MNNKIKIIDITRVYHGYLNVDKVTLTHQKYDGSTSKVMDREVVVRNDAVAAVLYHPLENNFWFVEQIRVPTVFNGSGYLWECVAGLIDDGESPEQAIKREILEEVGFDVSHLESIGSFYSTPGGCSEKVHLYFAHVENQVQKGGGLVTENEDIKVIKYNSTELKQLYFEKKIEDGKTLIAVQWLLLHHPQIIDNKM